MFKKKVKKDSKEVEKEELPEFKGEIEAELEEQEYPEELLDEEEDDEDDVEPLDVYDDKEFVQVIGDNNVVYFLEADGNWWRKTFNTVEQANAVVNAFLGG